LLNQRENQEEDDDDDSVDVDVVDKATQSAASNVNDDNKVSTSELEVLSVSAAMINSSSFIEGVDNGVLLATLTVIAQMSLTIYYFFEMVGRSRPQLPTWPSLASLSAPAPPPAPWSTTGTPPSGSGGPWASSWWTRSASAWRAASGEEVLERLSTPVGMLLVAAACISALWLVYIADAVLWRATLFDARATALLFFLSVGVAALELHVFGFFHSSTFRRND